MAENFWSLIISINDTYINKYLYMFQEDTILHEIEFQAIPYTRVKKKSHLLTTLNQPTPSLTSTIHKLYKNALPPTFKQIFAQYPNRYDHTALQKS